MGKIDFQEIFKKFEGIKVLIIGDVMLDSYVWGTVNRISPEAPVPIVNVQKRDQRLGGAANVALNIQALGAEPILCSVIGNDMEGESLMRLMATNDMGFHGIVQSFSRITTVKHRIMSGSQHLLRVDSETDKNLNEDEQNDLWRKITALMVDCQVVIFEDYDKGVLNGELIQKIVKFASERNIPTIVDPKKRNFLEYRHVTLFKPNLKELKEGLKIDFNAKNQTELEDAVNQLKDYLQADKILVTLSERGVYIQSEKEKYLFPAHIRSIADVSGAGDTVVSIAALCLALNLSDSIIAALSNLGGGLVCEDLGVIPIDKMALLKEAEENLTQF